MRLEQLQYLVTISQHTSLSAAAETLHLTPQALSMSITALEKDLGLTLLNRSFKGVSLTEDGRLVLEAVERFLGTLAAIQEKSQGQTAEALCGTYEILTAYGEFNAFFLELLTHAAKDFPNCTLRVRPTAFAQMRQQALSGPEVIAATYDCRINGESLFPCDDALELTPLFDCQLLAFTPRSLAVAVYKTLSVKSLLDQPLIVYQPDQNDQPLVLRILHHFGQPKQLTLHTSSPLCQSMVQNGQGIGLAVLPRFQRASGEQIVRQNIRDDIQITFGLLTEKGASYPPDIGLLRRYIQDFAQTLS